MQKLREEMEQRTVLLCLILSLLATSVPAQTAESTFDFYYLVLTWPGAYCSGTRYGCCVPKYGYPAEDFFVQSLMTFDSEKGQVVAKCNTDNKPFDINKLDPIENNLNHYWSSIKCPRSDAAETWKSAWESYGVCSGLKEVDYFRAGLQLRKNADVLSALSEQGINPDYKLYSTVAIKRAVNRKLGVTPGVQCRDGPFGKKQLYELFLCVDKDAKTFIECPALPPSLCPAAAEILFHPFHTWMLSTTTPAADAATILLPTDEVVLG